MHISSTKTRDSLKKMSKHKHKDDAVDESEETNEAGRDHDHFLPIANVSRIMKRAVPNNAKISKDSKETVQECVSELISFVTGEASHKCLREKRKTINGDDLLWAMTTLGFEDYVQPLRVYLMRYREAEGDRTMVARETDAPPDAGGVVVYNGIHCYDGFHHIAM